VKQRVYIDTSVFGGYYDDEFAEHTSPLFNRLKNNEFKLLFSSVTQDELNSAPVRVKDLVTGLKAEWTEFLDVTDEATELAAEYIAEGVVG
jgi:predicted nucleic acid-binding protein